jgi:competence CoiA-like predicted nuclease
MTLVAIKESGEHIFAKNVTQRETFRCKGCGGLLYFCDATLKAKYFQHAVACNCETEPETPEHIWGKQQVFDSLTSIKGQPEKVEMEEFIGRLKADIFWKNPMNNVAIEVQATNYNILDFEEKIHYYIRRKLKIIYLFVGDNFCKQIKPYVYSLKEIEKRIIFEKKYNDYVIGGYLESDCRVMVPSFQKKYAHGGGKCENRFFLGKNDRKYHDVLAFLKLHGYSPPRGCYIPPPCKHESVKHVLHDGKIKRYKTVCEDCFAFVSWLKNDTARDLGLEL